MSESEKNALSEVVRALILEEGANADEVVAIAARTVVMAENFILFVLIVVYCQFYSRAD